MEKFSRSGLSAAAFARMAGIKYPTFDQTQISRILRGDFRRITENVRKVCKFAGIDCDSVDQLSPSLETAVAVAWDGSQKHEKMLVRMLKSLSDVIQDAQPPAVW